VGMESGQRSIEFPHEIKDTVGSTRCCNPTYGHLQRSLESKDLQVHFCTQVPSSIISRDRKVGTMQMSFDGCTMKSYST
jgi:hypothetical protein